MRKWCAVFVAMFALGGCSAVAPTTPATAPPRGGITPQLLALLAEEHLGSAAAVTGQSGPVVAVRPTEWVDGLSATAYYRATPGQPAGWLTVSYSPMPYAGADCTGATCTERDGVQVRSDPDEFIARRDPGFVQVEASAAYFEGELLEAAIALAADPRIAPTVDGNLLNKAAANPRWRDTDDLGCGDASLQAPIALPEPDDSSQPATPQALAAVVASQVDASCAGDESATNLVRGTVYLGADTERVSLAINTEPIQCPYLDACEQQGDLIVARQLDVPTDYPVRIVLARPLPDGNHWVVVEHASLRAQPSGNFPVPLSTLKSLVSDARVGAQVDAALNRAGDELPLRWRLTPRTSE